MRAVDRKEGREMLSCWHGTHEAITLTVAYTRLNCEHLVMDGDGLMGLHSPWELMAVKDFRWRSSHW